jgi:hypothetical protein
VKAQATCRVQVRAQLTASLDMKDARPVLWQQRRRPPATASMKELDASMKCVPHPACCSRPGPDRYLNI